MFQLIALRVWSSFDNRLADDAILANEDVLFAS
jgi:hypothetical protein